jgi:hypothetical protein
MASTNVTNYTVACTLEAFIKPDFSKCDSLGTIIAKQQYFAGTVNDFPIALIHNGTSNLIEFRLSTGNDYNVDLTLSTPILEGWQHVAAVYRANGLCELYVNGVLKNSATFVGTISSTSIAWTIGSSTENGGGIDGSTFNGSISDAAVYGTALTGAQIQAHVARANLVSQDPHYGLNTLLLHANGSHASTTTVDSSTGLKTITSFNGASLSIDQFKFGNSSMFFNGSNQYFGLTNYVDWNLGARDFTIECWVRPSRVVGDQCIIACANGSAQNSNYAFALMMSDNKPYFRFYNVNTAYGGTGNLTVAINEWCHLVAIRNKTTLEFYVNGKLSNQTNVSTIAVNNPAGSVVQIGTSKDNFYPYQGYIDELRITKNVARYAKKFTPPTEPFEDPY